MESAKPGDFPRLGEITKQDDPSRSIESVKTGDLVSMEPLTDAEVALVTLTGAQRDTLREANLSLNPNPCAPNLHLKSYRGSPCGMRWTQHPQPSTPTLSLEPLKP
jgi:hypothetical protein